MMTISVNNQFKKGKKKLLKKIFSLNRWSVFGLVSLFALLTIFYVYNVNRVNNLLKEIRNLEHKHELLKNTIDQLKAEVNSLQSADRIIPIARQKIGLINPSYTPIIIP